jgi:predicted acylesterase/phospholipase RssA
MEAEREPSEVTQRVHLLLSSGGFRCLSYIGALQQLQRRRYEAATVSTCSAGTFVGALYCCGLTPDEIQEAVLELDLREITGPVWWRPARFLWSLRSRPYVLPREGFAKAFRQIMGAVGRDPDPTLGDLDIPLFTAALDIVGQQLLAYSSKANPDMRVGELLSIAVAIPFLYPPHRREGRELLDASLASHTPVWLATGQEETLPVVVLRAPVALRPGSRRGLKPWVDDILYSSVAGRDNALLARLPQVSVYDIQTTLPARSFTLPRGAVDQLIQQGRTCVADRMDRESEPGLPLTGSPDDDGAQRGAADLYGRHLNRLTALTRPPTVFISRAREDRAWVERLRPYLVELLDDPEVFVWDDSYIRSGDLWDLAIQDAITRARVAVLLVSRSFLASTYITERELSLLRDRRKAGQVRVLWISLDGSLPPEEEQAVQGFVGWEHPLGDMPETAAEGKLRDLAREIERAYRGNDAPDAGASARASS